MLTVSLLSPSPAGGFVCLGQFLHEYLTGTNSLGAFPNPGYQSSMRANPLAQKILANARASAYGAIPRDPMRESIALELDFINIL